MIWQGNKCTCTLAIKKWAKENEACSLAASRAYRLSTAVAVSTAGFLSIQIFVRELLNLKSMAAGTVPTAGWSWTFDCLLASYPNSNPVLGV